MPALRNTLMAAAILAAAAGGGVGALRLSAAEARPAAQPQAQPPGAAAPAPAAKPNVILFRDYEDRKVGQEVGDGAGFCKASDEKHVLGKLSACINCGCAPSAGRGYPPDMLVFGREYPKWDKEAYLRWYLYLNKEFDLPDVGDGYWPAPKCFGLKKGEGWTLHFMTDSAIAMYTSTYIAKAGDGFRVVVLSQENPPEDKAAWLAKATPEFRKAYAEEFPWAKAEEGGGRWDMWKGQAYDQIPWNPNYVWMYGTKDGEREPMIRRERWYCLELHLKAASGPGKRDGVVEFWLDGKSIFARRDMNNDQGSLSRAALRGGIHDHDRPVLGSKMYIDNVVIDTNQYIGPLGHRPDLREREAAAIESLKKQTDRKD